MERALADGLNNKRISLGKRPIPLSENLGALARMHAWAKVVKMQMKGHLHSWPDWEYFDDHRAADKMRMQPRRLTRYQGDGYEVAVVSTDISADSTTLLDALFNSPPHRAAMFGEGPWHKTEWRAMGVGYLRLSSDLVVQGQPAVFMCIWFGEKVDVWGGY